MGRWRAGFNGRRRGLSEDRRIIRLGENRVAHELHPGAVAWPGEGLSFGEAARQMAAAYRHYLEPPHRLDWDWVVARQKAICYDGRNQVVR